MIIVFSIERFLLVNVLSVVIGFPLDLFYWPMYCLLSLVFHWTFSIGQCTVCCDCFSIGHFLLASVLSVFIVFLLDLFYWPMYCLLSLFFHWTFSIGQCTVCCHCFSIGSFLLANGKGPMEKQ